MKFIALFSLTVILFSCKSSQFEKATPFKIEKGFYQNWVGGQPGVRGTKIEFSILNLEDNVTFKNVYFKNTIEKLYLRNSDKKIVISANINTANKEEINMVMHKDANKEYGNKLPTVNKDFPFELKENECVISYLQNGNEKFYKLILTREKDVFYP